MTTRTLPREGPRDVIFVDTSSTYFEVDVADELAELATALGEQEARGQAADQDVPGEEATRRFSKHSKNHRPDLPQVVLGMAVTAEGIPVRCWTFARFPSSAPLSGTLVCLTSPEVRAVHVAAHDFRMDAAVGGFCR